MWFGPPLTALSSEVPPVMYLDVLDRTCKDGENKDLILSSARSHHNMFSCPI